MDQEELTNPHRPDNRRLVFNVRLKKASRDAIKARADEENCTESDLVRRLMAFGMANMPKDWGK